MGGETALSDSGPLIPASTAVEEVLSSDSGFKLSSEPQLRAAHANLYLRCETEQRFAPLIQRREGPNFGEILGLDGSLIAFRSVHACLRILLHHELRPRQFRKAAALGDE